MTAGEFNLMKMLMQVLANQGVLLAVSTTATRGDDQATALIKTALAETNELCASVKRIMGR